jgi:ketosteroid isomerase-like protein
VSQENLDLTHRTIDAFNRRDLDALLALLDDDAEVAPGAASIEGNYHGHAGFRRWWESLFEGFSDFTTEVVELRDVGDLTLAVLRSRAHGAASGTLIEQRLWLVSEWRNRKVIWLQTFRSEAEALEAVGLKA